MSFSPTHDALEGFRLAGRRPVSFLVWTLFNAAILGAILYAIQWAIGRGMRLELQRPPTAQDLMALLGPVLLYALAAMLVLLVVVSIQVCAIYRAVLRPARPGLAYLRLGGAELGLILLQIILMLLVWIAEAVCIGVIVAVSASALQLMAKVLVGMLIGAALVALLLFLFVRLSLAGPVLVADGRLDLGKAWRLSRGRFWSLFGMGLLSLLLAAAVSMVAQALLRPFSAIILAELAPLGLRLPRLGWPDLPSLIQSPVLLGVFGVLGILAVTLQSIVQHAPWAAAYRDLGAADGDH